jgi:hypothetical protein
MARTFGRADRKVRPVLASAAQAFRLMRRRTLHGSRGVPHSLPTQDMGLSCNDKPDVRALGSRQAAGLVEAAAPRDIAQGADSGTVDLGAPAREAAMALQPRRMRRPLRLAAPA